MIDEARARSLAEAVAADLCAGRYDAVWERFHERMRRGLPYEKLRSVVSRELSPLGAFERVADARSWTEDEHVTVIARCVFAGGWAAVQCSFDADERLVGLYARAHRGAPLPVADDERAIEQLRRWLVPAAVLMLAVPVAYALLLRSYDEPFWPGPFIIGTMGWLLALSLRAPVAIGARKLAPERAREAVVASSGPLEEVTRWAALTMVSRAFAPAFSLGIGWAAIEVLFAIANGVGTVKLAGRDDPNAAAAREMLAETGASVPASPMLGVLERVSASGYHIGATLVLARWSVALPLLIVAHSALNLIAVRMLRRPWVVQLVVAAFGAVTLGAGLAAFGRLG